ncbi:MerR family transcriptional regulator [Afifella sp. IM 167]|uniref:MerR family transcriptional regulator n=1 Tax=Afifella sp. IM 167 TaxID=2033586 RepID=UPI001CCAB745|nr:MerR family transcriptional regulator [Afifella sp. IM 167]MBZ8132508.1 MerR family transcriptional regulator [Afifella sp. IM 167]
MSTKSPDAFRTISEVAEDLDLPQHVLRFWETRFSQIKPLKRGGGRRYYRPEDVDLLKGIRLLLYGEGFTIKGVQRLLKEKGLRFVVAVGQTGNVETVAPADMEGDAASAPAQAPSARAASEAQAPEEEGPLFAAADRDRLKAILGELQEARRILEEAGREG